MVQIEITDPELALRVLSVVDPITFSDSTVDDETAHRWLDDLTLKIQAALLHKAENTWKHMSSFERFYAEINEFGDIRINGRIWRPEFSRMYDGWIVAFPDNQGKPVPIDPIHFVKVYFDKELEL